MITGIPFLGLSGDLERHASCSALLSGLFSISVCFFQALSSVSLSFLCLILHQASTTGSGGPTQGHPYSNLLGQHLHLNSREGLWLVSLGLGSTPRPIIMSKEMGHSHWPVSFSTAIGQRIAGANLDHIEQWGAAIPKSSCWVIQRKIKLPPD